MKISLFCVFFLLPYVWTVSITEIQEGTSVTVEVLRKVCFPKRFYYARMRIDLQIFRHTLDHQLPKLISYLGYYGSETESTVFTRMRTCESTDKARGICPISSIVPLTGASLRTKHTLIRFIQRAMADVAKIKRHWLELQHNYQPIFDGLGPSFYILAAPWNHEGKTTLDFNNFSDLNNKNRKSLIYPTVSAEVKRILFSNTTFDLIKLEKPTKVASQADNNANADKVFGEIESLVNELQNSMEILSESLGNLGENKFPEPLFSLNDITKAIQAGYEKRKTTIAVTETTTPLSPVDTVPDVSPHTTHKRSVVQIIDVPKPSVVLTTKKVTTTTTTTQRPVRTTKRTPMTTRRQTIPFRKRRPQPRKSWRGKRALPNDVNDAKVISRIHHTMERLPLTTYQIECERTKKTCNLDIIAIIPDYFELQSPFQEITLQAHPFYANNEWKLIDVYSVMNNHPYLYQTTYDQNNRKYAQSAAVPDCLDSAENNDCHLCMTNHGAMAINEQNNKCLYNILHKLPINGDCPITVTQDPKSQVHMEDNQLDVVSSENSVLEERCPNSLLASFNLARAVHITLSPACTYAIRNSKNEVLELPNAPGVALDIHPAAITTTTTEDPLEWQDFKDVIEEHFRDNDYIYILTALGICALIALYCCGKYCYIHCHLPTHIRLHLRPKRQVPISRSPIIREPDVVESTKFIESPNSLAPYRPNTYGQWRVTPTGIEVN
jgi:hypothetical protein